MAQFKCTLCAKCCTSFGEFIRIERQLSERDYYCRDGTTSAVFLVHVQPEFSDEIDERYLQLGGSGRGSGQKGCVFLCENPCGQGRVCAVYQTRPDICRAFKCYRMIIFHAQTRETRGWVTGYEVRTEDKTLQALWTEHIASLPRPAVCWEGGEGLAGGHTPRPLAVRSGTVSARIRGAGSANDGEWMKKVQEVLAAHGYHGELVE